MPKAGIRQRNQLPIFPEGHPAHVEMIQRKAARFCMNNYCRESSLTELIENLEWDALQLRRKQARLSPIYKLSNNLIDINLENLLSRNYELRTRRSHVFK